MPVSSRAFRDKFFLQMVQALCPTAEPISRDRLRENVGLEHEMFRCFLRWDIELMTSFYRYVGTGQLASTLPQRSSRVFLTQTLQTLAFHAVAL